MHDVDELLSTAHELSAEGQYALAFESYSAAAEQHGTPTQRRDALLGAAQCCVATGRDHEAQVWTARLRAETDARTEADVLEARARIRTEDPDGALALLEGVGFDEPSMRANVELLRARAHLAADRAAAAVDHLRRAVTLDATCPGAWRLLGALCLDDDVDPGPLLDHLPGDRFGETLGELLEAPAEGVDRVLESLWSRPDGRTRALVLVQYRGSELPLERALVWSARLREAGQPEQCPVLGLAANDARPAPERVRAAATASASFGDDRAVPVLQLAVSALTDDELQEAFETVAVLAPELIEELIVTGATTAGRALQLGDALARAEQARPAAALLRHAASFGGAPAVARARRGLRGTQLERLQRVARSEGATDVLQGLAT